MTEQRRGLGKCREGHKGSYGYPTRPVEPYNFCAECGSPMVWRCAACQAPVPEDGDELERARFCRDCGAPYFDASPALDAGTPSRTGGEGSPLPDSGSSGS